MVLPRKDSVSEEQIFTAAQILCGNLDESLNDDTGRGDAMLELLLGEPAKEVRQTKRIKFEEGQNEPNWSLERTRSLIRAFNQVDEKDHSSQRPFSLTKCWLGMSSTDQSKQATTSSFWALFQNALISMAHLAIAADLIDQSLDKKVLSVQKRTESSEPFRHIMSALEYWPANSSALILAANLDRMSGTKLQRSLDTYRAAMKCAHITCNLAQQVLLFEGTLSHDDKFLAETVLCQSAQEDDDGDSQVLVTASYMSALLASCLGQHDLAADSLKNFSSKHSPVTRIHPNVWGAGLDQKEAHTQPCSDAIVPVSQGAFCPCVFPDAISQDLFDVLRLAFRSDGPYWEESGYDRNVYYSFWTEYPLPHPLNDDKKSIVGNAVEHYIVAHLMPRIQSVVGTKGQQVKGFEWWVHTRPHGANLGHQLHFDTDEALLDQDATVEFPIAATVTYLTLDMVSHGATILFDQTPYAKTNAKNAYISFPKSRSLLVFPGDLLHGVLPCISKDPDQSIDSAAGSEFQRLTFMVNFWSYRIPDRITKRALYGPSGPLPPPTKEHTWVHEICSGYPQTIPLPSDTIRPPVNSGLVAVSPAWDTVSTDSSEGSTSVQNEWSVSLESSLTLPASGGIHQRFFVTNAPDYFHSTLFEK